MTADPRRKLDVPPEWGAAASEIFERSLRTVLVIGGSAVGKSSFCRYLTEVLLARQAEVAFVDADIGQSNIGPPATVTLGYPVAPINFRPCRLPLTTLSAALVRADGSYPS